MPTWLYIVLLIPAAIIVLWTLISVPALFGIPIGMRKGLEPLTVKEAAARLKAAEQDHDDLALAATLLVHYRMKYSRCASYNPARSAFRRGYGYCIQQAYALQEVFQDLGYEAWVVGCLFCKLADGRVVPHAWVSISAGDKVLDYCPVFPHPATGHPTFSPQGKVFRVSPALRIFGAWAGAGLNGIGFILRGEADIQEYEELAREAREEAAEKGN